MKSPLDLLVEKRQELYHECNRVKEVFDWNIDDEFIKDQQHDLEKIKALIQKYDAVIDLIKYL